MPGASTHDNGYVKCAPIALFVFARPEHTRRTLDSLRRNQFADRSDVVVFADGPRNDAEVANVQATRQVVRESSGFASLTLIERSSNWGLARNIIDGVSAMCARHGRVIVLEDDLVLSPQFLRFMNDAMNCYENDEAVASIHGYRYPTKDPLPETFFLRGADCWGWATWSRAWSHFNQDGADLLRQLREHRLTDEFDLDGASPNVLMLEDQIVGKNDSWAIRWHASCYLKGLLTLYPGRSLVNNIGNDASGTHGGKTDKFSQVLTVDPVPVQRIALVPSEEARSAFIRFFRERPTTERVGNLIRRLLRRVR